VILLYSSIPVRDCAASPSINIRHLFETRVPRPHVELPRLLSWYRSTHLVLTVYWGVRAKEAFHLVYKLERVLIGVGYCIDKQDLGVCSPGHGHDGFYFDECRTKYAHRYQAVIE